MRARLAKFLLSCDEAVDRKGMDYLKLVARTTTLPPTYTFIYVPYRPFCQLDAVRTRAIRADVTIVKNSPTNSLSSSRT